MITVYLDNNIVSAISRRDLPETELHAIDQLLDMKRSGTLVLISSRQSFREMERAPSKYQADLKEGFSDLIVTEDDHRVLGFHTQIDPFGGCISNPLVADIVDEVLYLDLRTLGLDEDDAKHLMYAVHNGYQQFLTCDNGILRRRTELEKLCGSIHIQKPSELVAALSDKTSG